MTEYIEFWDTVNYSGQQAEWAYKDYELANKLLPFINEDLKTIVKYNNKKIPFRVVNKLCKGLFYICSQIILDNKSRNNYTLYDSDNENIQKIDSNHIETVHDYINNLSNK